MALQSKFFDFLKLFTTLTGISDKRNAVFLERQLEIIMKKPICGSFAMAVLVTCLSLNTNAQDSPGMVDFGKFTPPGNGGEFVEVQVKSNLISLAARLVEKEEPEAAELLRNVELVRVNVVGLNDDNRDEMTKRVEKIRAELDAKGWERNVNVQGKKGEDVGVYTKTRGTEALAGVTITIIERKNIVLANVVGDIRPEQVAALGESLNIEPLKEAAKAIKK